MKFRPNDYDELMERIMQELFCDEPMDVFRLYCTMCGRAYPNHYTACWDLMKRVELDEWQEPWDLDGTELETPEWGDLESEG